MKETPPPENVTNDFVGYEVLVDFMTERTLYDLNGDIVEIGAFLGGGTAKLAKFAQRYGKKVYAVDIFDPLCDQTQDTGGTRMCDVYEAFLQGRSQREVYRQATGDFQNIITIDKDSKEVEFPQEQGFIFGFIDGNHHAEHVRNDFYIIWRNLVPGGVLGFHDYNFDLPEVTEEIDRLIDKHRDEITEVYEIKERHIVLLAKKNAPLR
ncbi:MAG: class I SAM-dependent methyltransferase [Dehalococcoidia bacterium]